MTVDHCATLCYEKAFKYVGVQNGTVCACNNDGPVGGPSNKLATMGDKECNVTCGGNVSEACGGLQRVSLYKSLSL